MSFFWAFTSHSIYYLTSRPTRETTTAAATMAMDPTATTTRTRMLARSLANTFVMYTDWPPLLIATALTITSTSTEAPTPATAMVARPTLLPVVERTKPTVTWLHTPVHGRSFQVVLLLGGFLLICYGCRLVNNPREATWYFNDTCEAGETTTVFCFSAGPATSHLTYRLSA